MAASAPAPGRLTGAETAQTRYLRECMHCMASFLQPHTRSPQAKAKTMAALPAPEGELDDCAGARRRKHLRTCAHASRQPPAARAEPTRERHQGGDQAPAVDAAMRGEERALLGCHLGDLLGHSDEWEQGALRARFGGPPASSPFARSGAQRNLEARVSAHDIALGGAEGILTRGGWSPFRHAVGRASAWPAAPGAPPLGVALSLAEVAPP